MEIMFLCVVIFLFMLAIFDLSIGVSNDAVNFLNSAIGTKAASLKRIIIIASIGVFIGAAMSNGMMDIARHGIFRPLILRPHLYIHGSNGHRYYTYRYIQFARHAYLDHGVNGV